MNKKEQKKKWFEHLLDNFNYVKASFPNLELIPNVPDIIPCPLCLTKFISRADLDVPNLVTLEHAISEQLGGKIVGLTCKSCNSNHGSLLDRKLIDHYKIIESLSGNSQDPIKTKLRINNSYPVFVNLNIYKPNLFHIKPLKPLSKTALDAKSTLEKATTSPPKEVTFEFSIPKPAPNLVQIAFIRAAYLTAFGQYGYGFIVNPSLNYIRNLFKSPKEQTPHNIITPSLLTDDLLGVNIITHPIEMRSYLIVFDLFDQTKKLERVGVVLPGWIDDDNPTPLFRYLTSVRDKRLQLRQVKS